VSNPRTLGEAIDIFIAEITATCPPKKRTNTIHELKSALARFAAPALGFEKQSIDKRSSKIQQEAAIAFLKNKSLRHLPSLLDRVQQFFTFCNVAKSIRNTYGGRIRQFHDFCYQQPWYPDRRLSSKFRDECAPKLPQCFGRTSETVLMPQKNGCITYGLGPEDICPSLKEEFDQFFKFCCASYYPGRVIKICTQKTAGHYLDNLQLFLGWWWRYYQPDLAKEELSLRLLIPLMTIDDLERLRPKEQKKLWREARHQLSSWIDRYFEFLTNDMGSYSPRTRCQKIMALSKLARWLYSSEVDANSDYQQIPIIGTLKDINSSWSDKVKDWDRNHKYAADQRKKWPDTKDGETALSSLRQGLLKQLCLRCRPRNYSGALHKSRPQARFLAAYLVWFELAFEPPRRQQEFRTRRVALTCPIDRPSDVPVNGFYHPLLPNEVRERSSDGSLEDNYLYRTYNHNGIHYPEGVWIRQITQYKTSKAYGQQEIILRDRLMNDGKSLYFYLESYLYGYWYTASYKDSIIYDWWDVGLKGKRGYWLSSGVMSFEPIRYECHHPKLGDWPWMPCFPVPDTGKSYTHDGMAAMIQRAAHEWIGKRTTPHLMRHVWATWAFQVGLDDKIIHSLAYAMGNSYETLKKWYEEATPADKRRPIEETIDEYFIEYLDHLADGTGSSADLRKVLQLLPKLSPEDRQVIQQVLAAS
jgi:hypothetical protein